MHVLVTGAAGFLGRDLLAHFAQEGVDTTALVLEAAHADLVRDRTSRVVVGDARDPAVVADALTGADAVVHLAAIPNPLDDPAEEVFGRNTLTTFVVLDQAGRAGITRAAIASSYSILGTAFPVRATAFPYLPVDLGTPLQISDPYGLSKQVDEATAEMAHARYGMDVVALRLPYLGNATQRLAEMAQRFAEDPGYGAPYLWSYLDNRDAARMFLAALRPARPGAHAVFVAAPETLAPYPTRWLLDQFHPGVPVRAELPGRAVPIDLAPATQLLGVTAVHLRETP